MNLTIGFSPCPNDTFIFDALVNDKIDTEGLTFRISMEDVQTLNELSLGGALDITKISYGVFPLVTKAYVLLNSGSALGSGVGPLLIGQHLEQDRNIEDAMIAIPGQNTTANLLFSLAYPKAKNKKYLRYDEVENFVIEGRGYGVIIHENRFTYQDKGLIKIMDLGEYWEKQTTYAIPLGGIVIKRSYPIELQQKVDRLVKKSIEFAFKNYPVLNNFITTNAQEMSEAVMRQHIELYVNGYSLDLGEKGKKAVVKMVGVFNTEHNTSISTSGLFV